MRSILFILPLTIVGSLFSGCATRNNVATKDNILHRKHARGWRVALHPERPPAINPAIYRTAEAIAYVSPRHVTTERIPAVVSLRTSLDGIVSSSELVPAYPVRRNTSLIAATAINDEQPLDGQENLMPKKKWNHWAVPAFLSALGTLALGFGGSTLAVLAGVVITVTLAGIALRRGRSNELSGKGFAIAALLCGILAGVLLGISIAAYGIL